MDKYIVFSRQNLWEVFGKDIHRKNELTLQGSAIIDDNRMIKRALEQDLKGRITLSVHTGVVGT